MDTKYYTVAGKSVNNGVVKVRFANNINRVKTLERSGHTNIDLFNLPGPMTKDQVVDYLDHIGYIHKEEMDGNIIGTVHFEYR